MLGVDVHYAGAYRVEGVAGSTDDVKVHYEAENDDYQSLLPLAISAFGRACKGNHAESCRRSGQLVDEERPVEARAFYGRAFALHDQPACERLAQSK